MIEVTPPAEPGPVLLHTLAAELAAERDWAHREADRLRRERDHYRAAFRDLLAVVASRP